MKQNIDRDGHKTSGSQLVEALGTFIYVITNWWGAPFAITCLYFLVTNLNCYRKVGISMILNFQDQIGFFRPELRRLIPSDFDGAK